ncbi:LysR substrate-binding domain-containing protein [Cupriavidus neocaledonicus]|uniref:Transcriptional regulator, LysR family n=1 Tax=Cupriavidus neocaledonicus TaxID=1040979 RepID=A0A375HVI8_9BURK|nr:LysR substrate-binding domain-containing protein [Cupriavidus neocaledonicus]SOZ39637.1 putative transcriptional regulator, LysR family [Cupriavidus neocaledonicus]SPD61036.1 putative transcriptional regulator, LysR family [Cupriavidus neocaledonicus]
MPASPAAPASSATSPAPEALPTWHNHTRLKTRQLLLLLAVADEGSIHRAAERLAMTQPAASKLLRELEELLSVPLFERLPRGMAPTDYGRAMIRHARAVVGSLNQAREEVLALKAGRLGHVAIGAITSPGVRLLPAAIAQVKARYPGLRVSVEIDNSNVLLDRLGQEKLDMVVARLFPEHDKGRLRYEPMAQEPVCAVVRPGHPMLAARGLSLADAADAAWLIPPAGTVLRHRFELMFQRASLAPPVNVVETAALLFLTRMVTQSDMIAVLTADVAQYYAAFGMVEILPMAMPCHMDDFGLITPTDRLMSPGALLVAEALREAAQAIYGGHAPG